jgi:succinate dehydrogenase / fumarate reductase, membrane anchor subunit
VADMRTPLNKVRGLGSAKDGTGHFWRIRLTAIALLPLSLFAVGWVLSMTGAGYTEVRASLGHPLIALLLALFVVISLDHMRLGMQIIIEDYVHGEGAKVALLMLNIFFAGAIGAMTVFSVLKIAFGG